MPLVDGRHNLFGMTESALEALASDAGLARYRVRQIYRGMYARGVAGFEAMTDLPKSLRADLERRFVLRRPRVKAARRSRDGTVKTAFELEDARVIEAVYIPEPPGTPAPERATVCLSTQVGCPLACTFCYSGTIAFARNLTPGEILGQFIGLREDLDPSPPRINVVYMGMGEPLLNARAVLDSLAVLTDPQGLAVSARRVTVSTAGLAPQLERFVRQAPKVGLAVSLHAADNTARSRWMPINRKYPIDELIETIRRLPLPRRRRVTFEYVLLGGENDSEEDARALARRLRGLRAKVNLIAYNPWPGAPHRPSSEEATQRFLALLVSEGYTVSLRRSRGADVLAACGQLAGTGGSSRRP